MNKTTMCFENKVSELMVTNPPDFHASPLSINSHFYTALCYRLNVCVFPKFICGIPNPQVLRGVGPLGGD